MDLNKIADKLVDNRIVLLTDNWLDNLSRQFSDFLRSVGIRYIITSPYHPQTSGEIEKYHRAIKGKINLLPYDVLCGFKEAINVFIKYFDYHRYHWRLHVITRNDV